MPDLILVDGDRVQIQPAFGPATVTSMPATIKGSGQQKIEGKPVCVEGDEKSVNIIGCTYMTPEFSIPGVGTITIVLAPNQRSATTKDSGKAVLVKGGPFTAIFNVLVPAKQPPAGPGVPIPDPTPQYTGSGMFVVPPTRHQKG